MVTNMGSIDRLIRLVVASALLYLGLFFYSGTSLGLGLTAGGGLTLFSATFGFCGLYKLLGINTK
ncbi:DUF2892 domain-containing protein [Synechocystis salina LEGE 06099]|uniref:YgaP family membrane protein n=1 Tax=Synechocystis salina TaxID=945780 RepID=UPI001882055B|nr:DUF2892 domain-containing protein [Synechocystis salina]MBE9203961.1 DUF2892 domain-containing protein [Synechocystis salina LEGE 06099]